MLQEIEKESKISVTNENDFHPPAGPQHLNMETICELT